MCSVLSGKTLHENIVQGCGKLFHMLTIWFFYRHFGVESVPDPLMTFWQKSAQPPIECQLKNKLFVQGLFALTMIFKCFRFFTSLVTYGVILNAVNLAGDLYLNIVFMGLVQPGTLIPAFTLDIPGLGRRKHILGGFLLTGASLLLSLAVPNSMCSNIATFIHPGAINITIYITCTRLPRLDQ